MWTLTKNIKYTLILICMVTILIAGSQDKRSNNGLLVTAEWLLTNIDDPNLVLLHVGMPHDFENDHIEGSVLLPWRDIITPRAPEVLSDEFPSYAQLDSVFESLGINTNSKVVVYYGDDRFIPLATRTIVTLEYLGFDDNVYLLNGGYQKLKSEEISFLVDNHNLENGKIDKLINKKFLIDSDYIYNNLNKIDFWIIDSRPEESYTGHDNGHFTRNGHIKGAVNIPFTDFLDSQDANFFKTDSEMCQIFENYFINKNSELVFYCGTGIWATVNYVIAKHLGFENIMFYDGSFEDWSAKIELPIVEPLH